MGESEFHLSLSTFHCFLTQKSTLETKMKKEIPNPYADNRCFICGSNNTEGLQLKFFRDDETDEIYTDYISAEPFFGQGDILHGAIQMGLLDEIMGWATHAHTGEMAVTSEISVKFLAPFYMGKQVRVTCRVTSQEGRRVHLEASLTNADGVLCSRAAGTYHVLPPDKYEALIHNG